MRTCTTCSETKPIEAFTPIKGTPYVYGRCKACRAAARRGGGPPRTPDQRTCKCCGQTKPLTPEFFLPIKGQGRFYGPCRTCRNARARERYHSSETIRRAQIASAWRNKPHAPLAGEGRRAWCHSCKDPITLSRTLMLDSDGLTRYTLYWTHDGKSSWERHPSPHVADPDQFVPATDCRFEFRQG